MSTGIIKTPEGMIPSAALSYRQEIMDIADEKRSSYRGAALELRESMRETLDHLAPDKEVIGSDWYVQEKGEMARR
jgi:hypothetical protein